jgi:hypothetical protein
MTTYKLAHVRQGGEDMIIFPLSGSFGSRSNAEQEETMEALRYAASSANLAGNVVLIWQSGNRVYFRAPSPWHPFFKSPGIWSWVMRNVNKQLTL